jgi:hypothetical protein
MRRDVARIAVLLLLVGLLGSGCTGAAPTRRTGSHRGGGPAGAWPVIRGARVTSVIVIGPNGEVFTRPPASTIPRLTARQAWNASYGLNAGLRNRTIPPFLSYRLGLLTVPPSVTDVLAWGFSGPPGPCPLPRFLPLRSASPAPAPTRPSGRCIQWTFINAANGSNPEGTWQRLGAHPPVPHPATALRAPGFLDAAVERFDPQHLVVQAPLSTIRWTFSAPTCSITMHWFEPPLSQVGPARPACHWQRAFTIAVVSTFASNGRVFTVIAGHVARWNFQLVRAILADGRTWVYDPRDGNASWLFVIQRCGKFQGTMPRAIEEITITGAVIAKLPIPAYAGFARADPPSSPC